jgi:hypothetical protein
MANSPVGSEELGFILVIVVVVIGGYLLERWMKRTHKHWDV